MTVAGLYEIARENQITIDNYIMRSERGAFSVCLDGECYIALDPFRLKSTADEKAKLAHELGHCMTGAFYTEYSGLATRRHQEIKADKWAINKTIPRAELYAAYKRGYTQPWEVADYFDVPEDFARKAMIYYRDNSL